MTTDNVNIYDRVTADSLMPGDQTIIDGDLVIVREVKDGADLGLDPDEVRLMVENLSDPTADPDVSLCWDDMYDLWSM